MHFSMRSPTDFTDSHRFLLPFYFFTFLPLKFPRRSQPAKHGEGFDAPPTLERSGSEHRRAVTSPLPEEEGLGEKVEPSLAKEGRGGSKRTPSLAKEGRGGSKNLTGWIEKICFQTEKIQKSLRI